MASSSTSASPCESEPLSVFRHVLARFHVEQDLRRGAVSARRCARAADTAPPTGFSASVLGRLHGEPGSAYLPPWMGSCRTRHGVVVFGSAAHRSSPRVCFVFLHFSFLEFFGVQGRARLVPRVFHVKQGRRRVRVAFKPRRPRGWQGCGRAASAASGGTVPRGTGPPRGVRVGGPSGFWGDPVRRRVSSPRFGPRSAPEAARLSAPTPTLGMGRFHVEHGHHPPSASGSGAFPWRSRVLGPTTSTRVEVRPLQGPGRFREDPSRCRVLRPASVHGCSTWNTGVGLIARFGAVDVPRGTRPPPIRRLGCLLFHVEHAPLGTWRRQGTGTRGRRGTGSEAALPSRCPR